MLDSIAFRLYKIESRILRRALRQLVTRSEGGEYYSQTLRRIFKEYHGVEVGMYTHGACFIPCEFDRSTKIGRYCSIARGVRALNTDHPMALKSTHAIFANPQLNYCKHDLMNHVPLSIGNDVWVGANALILPHTRRIGDGAVVAAGAVVSKDVPPYGVVTGNPARLVRFRFAPETITQLLASQWWDKPIEDLNLDEFTMSIEPKATTGELTMLQPS
jgi:acetyltransferase-like isoleucine patch superfamily enzyme